MVDGRGGGDARFGRERTDSGGGGMLASRDWGVWELLAGVGEGRFMRLKVEVGRKDDDLEIQGKDIEEEAYCEIGAKWRASG